MKCTNYLCNSSSLIPAVDKLYIPRELFTITSPSVSLVLLRLYIAMV